MGFTVNGYTINEIQQRALRQIILNKGMYTDVLATKLELTNSAMAFELKKLRDSTGMIVTSGGVSAYKFWSLTDVGAAILEEWDIWINNVSPYIPEHSKHCLQSTRKVEVYKVLGPQGSRYAPVTFASEKAAVDEATRRAKQEPGQDIQIFTLHKTVKWEPPVVPEGKLIIS